VNYRQCCNIQVLKFMSLLEAQRACPLKDEMLQFSKQSTTWKIILERMTVNVVICEVDSHVCCTRQGRRTRAL